MYGFEIKAILAMAAVIATFVVAALIMVASL
jgi:hypothetical protein